MIDLNKKSSGLHLPFHAWAVTHKALCDESVRGGPKNQIVMAEKTAQKGAKAELK